MDVADCCKPSWAFRCKCAGFTRSKSSCATSQKPGGAGAAGPIADPDGYATQAAFEEALKGWQEQYAAFLNERSVNEKTGYTHYTHKRLRAAYNSLKRHLPWLFTCERFPNLGIPNTTNLLEGKFSEMKPLLRCHRGLKKESKFRFI